jgi:hypothetical protein
MAGAVKVTPQKPGSRSGSKDSLTKSFNPGRKTQTKPDAAQDSANGLSSQQKLTRSFRPNHTS